MKPIVSLIIAILHNIFDSFEVDFLVQVLERDYLVPISAPVP